MTRKTRRTRRVQGAKRQEQRREALEIARQTAALQQWKARKEFTRELSELLAGR